MVILWGWVFLISEVPLYRSLSLSLTHSFGAQAATRCKGMDVVLEAGPKAPEEPAPKA